MSASGGAWDAMLTYEAEERKRSALERRRVLSRLSKVELIDRVIRLEGGLDRA